MRYLIFAAVFFLGLVSTPLTAQGITPGTAGPGSIFNDTMMVRITRRLQLTPEQQPQVRAIMNSYVTDLAENPPASAEEKRTRKRAARKQVMAILTPEQQARLKARRTARGGKAAAAPGKRNWLDSLLDDVASPLIERRQRKRGNGG